MNPVRTLQHNLSRQIHMQIKRQTISDYRLTKESYNE
jgi:hypothetical protein